MKRDDAFEAHLPRRGSLAGTSKAGVDMAVGPPKRGSAVACRVAAAGRLPVLVMRTTGNSRLGRQVLETRLGRISSIWQKNSALAAPYGHISLIGQQKHGRPAFTDGRRQFRANAAIICLLPQKIAGTGVVHSAFFARVAQDCYENAIFPAAIRLRFHRPYCFLG
jgi:hypothetical protein